SMLIPLYILAVLSVVGGWIGLPLLPGGNPFVRWLGPVFGEARVVPEEAARGHSVEILLMGVSLAIALAGIATAYAFYRRNRALPERLGARYAAAYRTLLHKYYVDELYDAVVVRPFVG